MAGMAAGAGGSVPEVSFDYRRKPAIWACSLSFDCGLDLKQLARQKLRQRFPIIAVPAGEEMVGFALREAGMVED